MGDEEIKKLIGKVLDKVESLEKDQKQEFTLLRTEISSYRTEILAFSSTFREFERDYSAEKGKLIKLNTIVEDHAKSISDIINVKDKIYSCPYCNKYSKESLFETDYIG